MRSNIKTILIIDDSENVRSEVESYLKDLQIKMIFAIDGVDGLQR